MQEIKPTYVSFEQAKLLKEKGFNLPVYHHYSENPVNDLIIFCEPDDPQAGNGWVLEDYNKSDYVFKKWSAPEQWQVVEWINSKAKIWIYIIPIPYSDTIVHWRWRYKSSEYLSRACSWEDNNDYRSSQEAYSAAFDYVLNKLI